MVCCDTRGQRRGRKKSARIKADVKRGEASERVSYLSTITAHRLVSLVWQVQYCSMSMLEVVS